MTEQAERAATHHVSSELLEAEVYKLFGCPYVLESEHCAVIRTLDEGYAFGRFRNPRNAFERIGTHISP
jgi:hypothetical protein